MFDEAPLKAAILESLRLSRQNQNSEALKILDEWIAKTEQENEIDWVNMLCGPASMIAESMDDIRLGGWHTLSRFFLLTPNHVWIIPLQHVIAAGLALVFRVADPSRCSKGLGFDVSSTPWPTNSFGFTGAGIFISSRSVVTGGFRFCVRFAPKIPSFRFLAKLGTATDSLLSDMW